MKNKFYFHEGNKEFKIFLSVYEQMEWIRRRYG